MFYSPIVEIIERLIKKYKGTGGRVYWLWVLLCSIAGFLFFSVLMDDGFNASKPFLITLLIIYPGFIYPLSQYEKYRKNKKDKR